MPFCTKQNIILWSICSSLFLQAENLGLGCGTSRSEPQGCSSQSLLKQNDSLFLVSEKETKDENATEKPSTMKITETLFSVSVVHEKQDLRIERAFDKERRSCPPFCIQPLHIAGVKNVAELEILTFIKGLNGDKPQLLVDARSSDQYRKSTIPGATNIPYTMLDTKSKYQKDVLGLLGGKLSSNGWYFKNTQTLLIFGNGAGENQASSAIKMLLALGYPQSKILYYRGGVESWKSLGLTLY